MDDLLFTISWYTFVIFGHPIIVSVNDEPKKAGVLQTLVVMLHRPPASFVGSTVSHRGLVKAYRLYMNI